MIDFFTKKVGPALMQVGTNLASTTTLVSAIGGAVAGGIAGGILAYVTTNADNREIQDMARNIKSIRILDIPLLKRYIQNGNKTPGKRALEGAVIGFKVGLPSLIMNRIWGYSSIICVIHSVIGAIVNVQKARPFLANSLRDRGPQCLVAEGVTEETETATMNEVDTATDAPTTNNE
ncbi:MAG: hypothetical protein LBF94_01215 [Puniceicoccales bacterium]|jgi:hypothetical protein|nr:hypothetical protein [Puniceicoccales bacterium]